MKPGDPNFENGPLFADMYGRNISRPVWYLVEELSLSEKTEVQKIVERREVLMDNQELYILTLLMKIMNGKIINADGKPMN